MRAMQLLRLGVMLLLAGTVPVAAAQLRPLCSTVLESEREFVRRFGGCRDGASIVDVAPKAEPAPAVVTPVPNVVGLSFDEARDRMAGFKLQRSYRASAEPGGTVLEQQPAPSARLAVGSTVRVVLSDATLRPAPRVSGASVDEAPKPVAALPDLQPQPAVVTNDTRAGRVIEQIPTARAVLPEMPMQSAPVERARVEQLRVPRVTGMTVRSAQARLGRFQVERSERSSTASIGRVIEQFPKASARAPAGSAVRLVVSSGPAPVTEAFELPNVVDRSYADASNALAEFKVDRIEIVASAAPSGQVLAQDPAPGTSVVAGSVVSLQVSDGSLANASVTAPAAVVEAAPAPAAAAPAPASAAPAPAAAEPAPAVAAPAPVIVERAPVTFPASTAPALIASALLVLALVAMAMRRVLLNRRPPEIDVEPAAQTNLPPTAIDIINVPIGEISFSARVDEGETTIEFAAPSDADETTLEHSRELHE